MNPEDIVGSILAGALGARRKPSDRALRYLVGGRHSFLNASTLFSAAAVAYGMYEASQSSQQRGATGTPSPPPPQPSAAPPIVQSAPPPPPETQPTPPAAPETPGVPPEVARLIRLMISAARADGDLAPEEGQQIARRASEFGAEELVRAELASPRPLAEIVTGVADDKQKQELYTLAFSIVRADESVSGAERIYLAQLAKNLTLDVATTQRLEAEASTRIDASGGGANG
jgi:uncharacterized membrane protein YebE (DUF533 family)